MSTSGLFATPTPTPFGIPISDDTGLIDNGWLHASVTPTPNYLPISNGSAIIDYGWLNASETPTAHFIPISNGSSVLDAGWIPDLSGTYQALNATLTAISALANAAGFLYNNGGGVFTYVTSFKSLFDHYANAGNTTTAETDLYSDTISANQLGVNGDKLNLEYGGTFVSSATATRQVKLYFGGTVIFDTGALTLSLSSAWTMYATIIRVSGTVVRYSVSFTTEGAALAAYTAVGELTGLTLSGTNVLKTTGQAAGVGAATNDIVAKLGAVSFASAA